MTALPDGVIIEPSFPVSEPVILKPDSGCAAGRRYFVAGGGRSGEVRLREAAELPGSDIVPPQQRAVDAREGMVTAHGSTQDRPAAAITIGGPTVRAGSRVELVGSIRDATGALWHRVKLTGPDAPGSDADRPDQVAEAPGPTGKEPNAGRPADVSQSTAAKKPGPSSGFVPAANLVLRWECRLEPAPPALPERETDSPPPPAPSPR